MSRPIQLSDHLYEDARRHAGINHRSPPKQIEHWATIGKMAEDNPDLPYSFIKDILLGLEEAERGEVTEFRFD